MNPIWLLLPIEWESLAAELSSWLTEKWLPEMPLPYAGLMSEDPASKIAEQNENLRKSVYAFGVSKKIEPFMTMAFIALSVIPHIKITTTGLIDVDKQERIPLFWDWDCMGELYLFWYLLFNPQKYLGLNRDINNYTKSKILYN